MLNIFLFIFVVALREWFHSIVLLFYWGGKHLSKTFFWSTFPMVQILCKYVETWYIWFDIQNTQMFYLPSYLLALFASAWSWGNCPKYQHRGQCNEPNNFCLSKFVLQHSSPSLDHRQWTPSDIMRIVKKISFSPYFCPGRPEEPMEYNCTWFELDPSISESGTSLCCGQNTSSGGQEVDWSFLSQSFFSKRSSHKIQVQT